MAVNEGCTQEQYLYAKNVRGKEESSDGDIHRKRHLQERRSYGISGVYD